MSKGLKRAQHTKLSVDIFTKAMSKSDRDKLSYDASFYNDIFEFISHNFKGYNIGHLKHVDYGEISAGVRNVIQYIQLNKDTGEAVNSVDVFYDEGFTSSDALPFD